MYARVFAGEPRRKVEDGRPTKSDARLKAVVSLPAILALGLGDIECPPPVTNLGIVTGEFGTDVPRERRDCLVGLLVTATH
jgi:hypothetical protein